jgi:hypothetical protein
MKVPFKKSLVLLPIAMSLLSGIALAGVDYSKYVPSQYCMKLEGSVLSSSTGKSMGNVSVPLCLDFSDTFKKEDITANCQFSNPKQYYNCLNVERGDQTLKVVTPRSSSLAVIQPWSVVTFDKYWGHYLRINHLKLLGDWKRRFQSILEKNSDRLPLPLKNVQLNVGDQVKGWEIHHEFDIRADGSVEQFNPTNPSSIKEITGVGMDKDGREYELILNLTFDYLSFQ